MAGLTADDRAQIERYSRTASPEDAARYEAELYKLRAGGRGGFWEAFPPWLIILIAVWVGLIETADKVPTILTAIPRYQATLAEAQAKMLQPALLQAQLDKAVNDAAASKYTAEAAVNQPRMLTAQADKAVLDAEAAKLQPALMTAQLQKARNDAAASVYQPDLTAVQLEKTRSEAKTAAIQPALTAVTLGKTIFEAQASMYQPKLNEVQLAKLGVETKTAVYQQGLTAANAIKAEQETAMSNAAMQMLAPMIGGFLKEFGVNLPLDKIVPQLNIIDPAARTRDLQNAMPGAQPISAEGKSADWQKGAQDMAEWTAWLDRQVPEERAGAEWWASVRSSGNHSCNEGARSAAFTLGCTHAKNRLARIDGLRKSSEEYRLGWSGK